MKTVKLVEGGLPERKDDEDADMLVKAGTHIFCKKAEWKSAVRDFGRKKVEKKVEKPAELTRRSETPSKPADGEKKYREKKRAQKDE